MFVFSKGTSPLEYLKVIDSICEAPIDTEGQLYFPQLSRSYEGRSCDSQPVLCNVHAFFPGSSVLSFSAQASWKEEMEMRLSDIALA